MMILLCGWLLVVPGATDVVVGRRCGNRLWGLRGLIEPGDKDGAHRGIGDGSDRQGAIAGCFQSVRSELTLQAEHAEGGSVSLLGMWSVTHQALNERGRVIAGAGGSTDKAFRRHAAMALMCLGHVLLDGGVATTLAAAVMHGNAFVVMENLDHAVG